MAVINIRPAERAGARLVFGLAGISGSGKTYTALQLAYGLVNYDAKKIGFLCTENRRGSLYADALEKHPTHPTKERFLIGDLYAPFSPSRYVESILEFQKAGVEVLIVDSASHEWEGTGGCEDIAHAGNPRLPKWNDAKREHKAFMNKLLACDMHIIVCLRAREKVRIERDDKGKPVVVPLGIMPICEKNFMFEMSASVMMWDEGVSQQVMKCPAELRSSLGRETGYITSADGAAIRAWVDGGGVVNESAERACNMLRTTTEAGMDALVEAWKSLPPEVRKAISPDGTCPDEFKRSAQEYDAAREKDTGKQVDELNRELMEE